MVVFKRGNHSHSIAPLEADNIIHAVNKAVNTMSIVYGEQVEKTLGTGFKWTIDDVEMVKIISSDIVYQTNEQS